LPKRSDHTAAALPEAKQRAQARLLPLDFVSGIGIEGGALTVHLVRSINAKERQQIRTITDAEAPGHDVKLMITGQYEKQ
jgi:hypothetical protein